METAGAMDVETAEGMEVGRGGGALGMVTAGNDVERRRLSGDRTGMREVATARR